MLKPKLIKILEKLFALGGNHDTERLLEFRDEFLGFLKEDDQILMPHNNENIVIAKDAIHFIDALNAYATTTNRVEAGSYVKHFFDRLIGSEKWNYYEIKFLIGVLSLTSDVKQALSLANKAIQALMDFGADPRFQLLSGLIAYHTISRVLYAKFFENNHDIDLEDTFSQWLLKLKHQAIAEPELRIHFDVAEIKRAILMKDMQEINRLMQDFEKNYDEKIVKVISNEVNFYIASKGYGLLYKGAG